MLKLKKFYPLFLAVSVLVLGFWITSRPAAASHVDPVFEAGNPSCVALGYDFGYKPFPEPPPSGTYNFPDGIHEVSINSDGYYFDWNSTLSLDAVIVKGGPNANVYSYDPEETADTKLHSPLNNDQPFEISHIEFCYDYEVDVSKTAVTTFTRTFEWDIEKSVDPATWDLFTGDSGTSEYTVVVTKTGYTDSDWAVSGSITIENNTPLSATIEDVSDVISGFGNVTVDCGVTLPYDLTSRGSLVCTYSTDLPNDTDRTNTATVTTSGSVGGGEGDAAVTFGEPTTLVNDEINVSDSVQGDLGTFSDSGSTSYTRTFSCDGDEGTHDNIATIVETGQSDDASVTVNCYALTVVKTANTSLTRTWDWMIVKSADQSNLTLSPGQLFLVNYEVEVTTSSTDSAWAVEGDITISNPHPDRDASLTAVTDIVSPNIAASVNCPALTVPAGGSLDCTYSASLPDGSMRTNTATATLQNYDFDEDSVATPGGTTDFDGSADVDFSGAAVSEVDECVDVNDTNVGFLGTVCADQAPATFEYSLTFGQHPNADVYLECGNNTHVNTAVFETNDTMTTDEDDWTVDATVVCNQGCTLTPGYWKTHSDYGPAPYDDTWAMLANGPDTAFFLSGQTYYDVLWTAPKGNAYYILAHAYIAAELNALNGADFTAVQSEFDAATLLFNTYTPDEIAAAKGKNGQQLRNQFIQLASVLDNYNNGYIGPGHCSE